MNFLRTRKLALLVPTCWPQGNHNRTRLPGGAAQARHLCGGCPDRLPMLARARERATKFSGPTTKAMRVLKHVIGPPSNMHLRCSRPCEPTARTSCPIYCPPPQPNLDLTCPLSPIFFLHLLPPQALRKTRSDRQKQSEHSKKKKT
jgi:hypothetical protein